MNPEQTAPGMLTHKNDMGFPKINSSAIRCYIHKIQDILKMSFTFKNGM